jgi:hypothetical protein
VPRLGELLFEFVRASDHARCRCELRYARDFWGVEAQFFINDHPRLGQRFDSRARALQWAHQERDAIETGGAWPREERTSPT